MAEVVIAEFMDAAGVARLAARFDTLYDPTLVDDPARLAAAAEEARALVVRSRAEVRAPLLERARRLTCIGRLGVGLDNIDLEACTARGVAVYPAWGANTDAVAEYVIAAVMVLLRGAFFAGPQVIAGAWPRTALVGRETQGKVMGLVGLGAIGRAVARRARALGMAVIAHDPFLGPDEPAWALAERVGLDALVARADAVSLHVPRTGATRNLFDAGRIAAMKEGAVLVNTARGGILDEAALVAALREGRLGGAALDVFAEEPVTAESGRRFEGVPNLILTPHIAGLTAEAEERVGALVAGRVIAHLEGRADPAWRARPGGAA